MGPKSNQERSLNKDLNKEIKRRKALDKDEEDSTQKQSEVSKNEMYQHIGDEQQATDTIIDSATDEQMKERSDKQDILESEDVDMEEEEEEEEGMEGKAKATEKKPEKEEKRGVREDMIVPMDEEMEEEEDHVEEMGDDKEHEEWTDTKSLFVTSAEGLAVGLKSVQDRDQEI